MHTYGKVDVVMFRHGNGESRSQEEQGYLLIEAGHYLHTSKGYCQFVQYQHGGDCNGTLTLIISDHEPPPEGYTYHDAMRERMSNAVEAWLESDMRLWQLKRMVSRLPNAAEIMAEYAKETGDEAW